MSNCKKANHLAIDYWYRYDYFYKSEELLEALAALTINEGNDSSFYVDFGATSHMTNDPGKLSYIKTYHGDDIIYVGNGNSLPISYIGEININTQDGQLNLNDVLVVLNLEKNLLSVGKLIADNFCTLEFTSFDFLPSHL